MTGIDAVLFDLDGVLVDSGGAIERVLRAWAAERGLDGDRAVALSWGRRDADLVRIAAPELDVATEVARISELEMELLWLVRALPGAERLLAGQPAGCWAVVTSSTSAVARGRIAAAGLPEPPLLVSAEDVERGKPAPDGYLLASGKLGVAPERCLVVEDAAIGVAAATAAGMRCVAVGLDGAELLAGVVATVADLRPIRMAPRSVIVAATL